MSEPKKLILDANIALRSVFGSAVGNLINRFSTSVDFYIPDVALADAHRHIPMRACRVNVDPADLFLKKEIFEALVHVVPADDYSVHERAASNRIRSRDISDWPIVATCLLLDAPLWTEDRDFFGCGIATWTTNNVGIYLNEG